MQFNGSEKPRSIDRETYHTTAHNATVHSIVVCMEDQEKRVLDAIRQGIGRPADICRKTCIEKKQVRKALSTLRKAKLVVFSGKEYKEAEGAQEPR